MAFFKASLPHFVTGEFKAHPVFLADDEYGRALDCLVKACTDVVIMDSPDVRQSRILLGKRIVEPQPDWWFMGGRMRPGETPEESVVRLLKREVGLHVSPEDVHLLGVHSYHWHRRVQPPAEHGTCDISATFSVVVSPQEAQGVELDPQEYSQTQWFTVEEVCNGEQFHPALRQSARDLLTRDVWTSLQQAVKEGQGDSAIAALARTLVQSGS